ncbi:hypothetical protein FEM03_18490 [Phragmitibacter flavus]|uniref:Tetratricopeptide repeat protein n=1 Tax=Phragmitibacter flavus TaxID=2576071 RepID=A0A5R8KAR7_9BACT|nr:hypothetical protein [Phragmitibacter flavus]TLD69357.1 hypothetical protein FEM03_18490 [Phragmitibacter flavus]
MRLPSQLIGPIVCILAAIAGLAALVSFNPTAREVVLNTSIAIFTVFTTPFILEITSVILFFTALLTYNSWRQHKDGNDWVYLVTQETEDGDRPLSPSASQRLQSQVLSEKPEFASETETVITVLEGYLELGMPSQALAELHQLPADNPDFIPLRVRILSANLQTQEAVDLLHQTFEAHPETCPQLVQAALENARWLLNHLSRRDLATQWIAEARQLHPILISPEDPLFPLANA